MKKAKPKRKHQDVAFLRALGFGRDGKFSYDTALKYWRGDLRRELERSK